MRNTTSIQTQIDRQRLGLSEKGHEPKEAEHQSAYLYESICNLLQHKIESSDLPEGALLKESALANHLGVSRAPVRRALAMLAERGLIRSAEGQGFIVGHSNAKRLTARELHDILEQSTEDVSRSASWERIFKLVFNEITSVLPFGTYRVLEAELGEFHHVSRTVAREVLSRLMDLRLIEKNRKSHWIVGQMTARDVRDSFEIRGLLEPHALFNVADSLDKQWLQSLTNRIKKAIELFPSCGAEEIDIIEHFMFETIFGKLKNKRILGTIRRNQISLTVPNLFRKQFPIKDDLSALEMYGRIIDLLISGDALSAKNMLRTHLERNEPLVLARLRVLAILPPPATVPYLTAVY